MNSRNLSIWSDLRPYSIGFEDLFRHFDLHLDSKSTTFPPYNIVKGKDELNWTVELALAGYNKKDIDVHYADNQLTIKSVKDEQTKEVEENEGMLHKGIAKRFFSKSFTIADDVEVKGAELKDGLLKVRLEKIVPEGKKPRTIKIK